MISCIGAVFRTSEYGADFLLLLRKEAIDAWDKLDQAQKGLETNEGIAQAYDDYYKALDNAVRSMPEGVVEVDYTKRNGDNDSYKLIAGLLTDEQRLAYADQVIDALKAETEELQPKQDTLDALDAAKEAYYSAGEKATPEQKSAYGKALKDAAAALGVGSVITGLIDRADIATLPEDDLVEMYSGQVEQALEWYGYSIGLPNLTARSTALSNLQEASEKLQKALGEGKSLTEVEKLKQDVQNANDALESLDFIDKDTLNAAEAQINGAKDRLKAAEEAEKIKQTKEDANWYLENRIVSVKDVEDAKTGLDTANTALTDSQVTRNKAFAALGEATTAELSAMLAAGKAQKAYEDALVSAARNASWNDKITVTKTSLLFGSYQASETIRTLFRSEILEYADKIIPMLSEETQGVLSSLQDGIDAAQEAYEDAKSNRSTLQTAYNTAQDDYDKQKTAVSDAEKTLAKALKMSSTFHPDVVVALAAYELAKKDAELVVPVVDVQEGDEELAAKKVSEVALELLKESFIAARDEASEASQAAEEKQGTWSTAYSALQAYVEAVLANRVAASRLAAEEAARLTYSDDDDDDDDDDAPQTIEDEQTPLASVLDVLTLPEIAVALGVSETTQNYEETKYDTVAFGAVYEVLTAMAGNDTQKADTVTSAAGISQSAETVTRQEMVLAIYSLAVEQNLNLSVEQIDLGRFKDFTDDMLSDEQLQAAVNWAVSVGLLRGKSSAEGGKTLSLEENLTQEQMLIFMTRFAELTAANAAAAQ